MTVAVYDDCISVAYTHAHEYSLWLTFARSGSHVYLLLPVADICMHLQPVCVYSLPVVADLLVMQML